MKYGIYTLGIKRNFFKNLPIHLIEEYKDLFEKGWGNGYVLIPPDFPYYNLDYFKTDVHGGITWSEKFKSDIFLEWVEDTEFFGDVNEDNYKELDGYWIIGFDTGHYGDNPQNCDKDFVSNEIVRLLDQCLDDSDEEIRKYKIKYLRRKKLEKIDTTL